MQFVVLCSARGTVLSSVIDSLHDGSLTAACVGVISDKGDRGCIALAQKAGLPVRVVPMIKGEAREDYDKRLHAAVREMLPASNDNLIACMGWQWMLSPWFVGLYRNRILNVHPALLPKHPGAHAHDLVLAAKETESGMTIHLIDEGMDTGKILLQKTCPVLPDDTVETLKARVQALECEWYPKVLEMIQQGEKLKVES